MTADSISRSPELMNPFDTALLVIDVQEKLLPAIHGGERVAWNIGRLIQAAKTLGVAIDVSEQYPKGLGPTISSLKSELPEPRAKLMFSCRELADMIQSWRERGIYKILASGIETHVCVQQTVLDLLGEGFQVYLAVDAVSSRSLLDHAIAVRRMDSSGATITTTEAAMFEWCERAGTAEFKQISALVKETGPQLP